jgi:hypothetical protein
MTLDELDHWLDVYRLPQVVEQQDAQRPGGRKAGTGLRACPGARRAAPVRYLVFTFTVDESALSLPAASSALTA